MSFRDITRCVYLIIENHHDTFTADSSSIATRIAEIKLYKPSDPISLEERIAPVITTGLDVEIVKSSKKQSLLTYRCHV